MSPEVTRRSIIVAGTAGAAAAALAACSSGTSTASESPSAAGSTPAPAPTNSGAASPSASATGKVITSVADVPVGGAVLVKSSPTPYVVGQESAGKVTCHVAICTHEGCKLNEISGENAVCPCHGSTFNVFTGAVDRGPATKPLPSVPVSVSGGNVVGG